MAAGAKTRSVVVVGPLGDGKLLFRSMSGHEALSEPFEYRVDLLSEDPEIKLEDVLGKTMSLEVELPNDKTRYFNGVISEIAMEENLGRLHRYSVVLRPWLWVLNHWSDCKIFQKMTVPEIVRKVMSDRGFTDVEVKLTATYRKLEYCVQYRETDFNFISRLLESAGIYYYFSHDENKHTLVLADDPGAHREIPGYEVIPYFPPDKGAIRERDHFYSWGERRQVQTAKYVLGDYFFQDPNATRRPQISNPLSHGFAKGETYDYPLPEHYDKDPDKAQAGEDAAAVRLQELQSRYRVTEGAGTTRGLSTGALFQLSGFLRADQNVKHIIVAAAYTITGDDYASSSGAADDEIFDMRVQAIPATTHYRPERRTPKPVISGPQTAIVVGKPGEEIHTDKYGRVRVQFHWDRVGQKNEDSSCWIRVAQLWAGKSWGAMFLPRIGQEVIVEFLEGDPDQPIITGRVYNGDHMPPYTLPDDATKSTIKSNTSKGGNGFNELRFEDKKGSEEIFFHAQKDFNREVREKDTLKVGTSGSGTQTIDIKDDRTVTIEKGNDTLTLQQGDMTVGVSTGKRTTTINGNDTLTVKTGNLTIDVTAGKTAITAGQAIELKVGGSSIKVEPAAITLSAPTIKVSGQGMAEVGSSGLLTLKGLPVKIN